MQFLTELTHDVDQALAEYLPRPRSFHPRLSQAMAYSTFAGGKRLRPALVLLTCDMLGGERSVAMPAACAIEMVHTYSLIHDDLPAMDNDDLRRGKPTCHKAFDEATAILAGDGLLTHAFSTIAEHTPDSIIATKLIATLARAAGPRGMVGGQMADMQGSTAISLTRLEKIHRCKTAALIGAALQMGAQSAGVSTQEATRLYNAGIAMGLAFQITDDLLDIESSAAVLGKSVGKDTEQNKATYPAIVGKATARKTAQTYCTQALDCFKPYGTSSKHLVELTNFILHRKK